MSSIYCILDGFICIGRESRQRDGGDGEAAPECYGAEREGKAIRGQSQAPAFLLGACPFCFTGGMNQWILCNQPLGPVPPLRGRDLSAKAQVPPSGDRDSVVLRSSRICNPTI